MNAHPVTDKRALLAQIGRRSVKAVVLEESPYADALLDVAYERADKREWSYTEAVQLARELANSTLTIREWLEQDLQ